MTLVSGSAKVRRHSLSASKKHARIWATLVSEPLSVDPTCLVIDISKIVCKHERRGENLDRQSCTIYPRTLVLNEVVRRVAIYIHTFERRCR